MSISTSYSIILNRISSNITLYIDYITLIFGIIGSLCNLITFTSREMYHSSSVFYLKCTSIFQFITILFCIITRLTIDRLTNIYSEYNFQNQSNLFCKLRFYFVITLPAITSFYLVLTSFNRYLITYDNDRIRLWTQIIVAKRLAISMMIFIFILSIHIIIFYDIYNNLCQIAPNSIYIFIFSAYLIIFIIFLPHILMFIFTFITILIIRKSQQRIRPAIRKVDQLNLQNNQRLELKLIKIIIIQVILSILFSILRLGSYSYNIISNYISTVTINDRAATTFAITIGGSLYFTNFALSFYVSMFTSKFFRNIFYKRITFFYRYYIRQLRLRNISQ